MKPHERVRSALAAGWSSACDGLAATTWFTYHSGRQRDREPYRVMNVRAGDRHVQISISPTGRSVQVYVDDSLVPKSKRRASRS